MTGGSTRPAVRDPDAAATPPLRIRVAGDPRARLAFSGRQGRPGNVSVSVGAGDPASARADLAALVGCRSEDMVFMEQRHAAGVARVGRGERGRGLTAHDDAVAGVDAMVTEDTGVALVVMVADCVPVLLVDPGRAVGAVHAGRGGVAAGVVAAAVSTLSGDPARVVAVVGPAIGGCCYEVPPDLADAVAADVPAARATTAWGTPALDLPAAVASQLKGAGVGRIEARGACTRCHPDRWFSHRGDPGAGRQAGIVARLAN